MALFEQRISEEDVTAARKIIVAGASLRSAAAAIPCAPSTLSTRIKKAEAAEADAHNRAGIRENRTAQSGLDQDLGAIAAGEGAVPGDVGPVEVLRAALHATKASGQPDWPTRVSAARALAALRPEEVEPKTKQRATASIVVYDLPQGTEPVPHRAPNTAEAPIRAAEAPSELPASESHLFSYEPADGESETIGMWSPADLDQRAGATVTLVFRSTSDPETAALWRAELSAGRLPQSTESAP